MPSAEPLPLLDDPAPGPGPQVPSAISPPVSATVRLASVATGHPVGWPLAPRPLDPPIVGAGRVWDLPAWQRETSGTSLLVADRGVLVHEEYAEGCSAQTLFLGFSMTKSVLAHLVGRAVTEGSLGLEDRVVDHVPEVAGSGYAPVRVRHLLTMTSGVDWTEDYRDPDGLATRLVGCFFAKAGDSRALLTRVPPGVPPGERWAYCTADSQLLDWVRERATGLDFVADLTRLWADLACESEASVVLDAAGQPLAGGGLAATARDWAKLVRLARDGTAPLPANQHSHRPLLSPAWVEEAVRPSAAYTRVGRLPSSITSHAGFGRHWWPTTDSGARVTADGSRGQFGYVDREHDVVVVKTSAWPYADFLHDRHCRDLSYLGLAAIADHTVATRPTVPAHEIPTNGGHP